MKKVMLISNRVMHYRVSVYNYFHKRFAENGYDFSVRSNELQKSNKHPLAFDFKEIPFSFSKYSREILDEGVDFVILFLHMKDKMIWPLAHWLRIKGIPFVFWTKGANLDDPDNAIKNMLFQHLHSLSSGIVLYSANETSFIKNKNRHKVTIANNTVNFADYPEVPDSVAEIKKEFSIPFKKVVLFVGRMGVGGGRKKVAHLIEIFRDIDDEEVGLVIVGSGFSDELQEKLNKRNSIYLGEVHDPDQVQISKLFKMADIFGMPGHVGLGLNQAFYWGLPVITEEGGQPPEVHYLVDGRNGFMVGENDIDAYREKLSYLLGNDKVRAEFSYNARKDILTNGSIEGMFQGFLDGIVRLDKDKHKKIIKKVEKTA
jgi:glycosyltransferase involved in cell wall biosynthesis